MATIAEMKAAVDGGKKSAGGSLVARVSKVFEKMRTVTIKSTGQEKRVLDLILTDGTGEVKTSIWENEDGSFPPLPKVGDKWTYSKCFIDKKGDYYNFGAPRDATITRVACSEPMPIPPTESFDELLEDAYGGMTTRTPVQTKLVPVTTPAPAPAPPPPNGAPDYRGALVILAKKIDTTNALLQQCVDAIIALNSVANSALMSWRQTPQGSFVIGVHPSAPVPPPEVQSMAQEAMAEVVTTEEALFETLVDELVVSDITKGREYWTKHANDAIEERLAFYPEQGRKTCIENLLRHMRENNE